MKKIILISLLLSLVGCQSKPEDKNTIRVGTISGPETALVRSAANVAREKYHITLKITEFSDYPLVNRALADGSLDANVFQHQPYLDAAKKAQGYDLIAIGKTFIYPMGIYSKKVKNLAEIPDKAVVAIPNDPSNEARALLLLQKAKLIQLKANASSNATPLDIAENPKQLIFKELDAAQLPRALIDVTLSVINTNYAIPAGLFPSRDAIFKEDKDSLYANLIVVRTKDQNRLEFQALVDALHSAAVQEKAKELFKGQAIEAW